MLEEKITELIARTNIFKYNIFLNILKRCSDYGYRRN